MPGDKNKSLNLFSHTPGITDEVDYVGVITLFAAEGVA